MSTETGSDVSSLPDFYPEYGLVKPLISFLFFFVVVDTATASLADRLDRIYDASLGDAGTLFAVLLWIALLASIRDVYKHQITENSMTDLQRQLDGSDDEPLPDELAEVDDGDADLPNPVDLFLSPRRTPSESRVLRGLQFGVGGILILVAWSPFLSRFGPFFAYLIAGVNRTTSMPVPVDFTSTVLWGAIWVVGIELFGRGVDRGLVDVWRFRIYEEYGEQALG